MKMMSSRPLLYISLPGMAFILGVFWFRHKNKKKDVTNKEVNDELKAVQNGATNDIRAAKNEEKKTVTQSININKSSEDVGTTKVLGKSAPIEIIQNGRSSQMNNKSNQAAKAAEFDTEVLKAKIEDQGYKRLRSIDEDFENMSSPLDLPDSGDKRSSFKTRNISYKMDAPVVVKASKAPKISPENSFLESKYTPCVEENNNQKEFQMSESNPAADHVVGDEQGNEKALVATKREVVNASPALSVCSNNSGDSGNGSSLPRSEGSQGKIVYEFFFPNSLIGLLYGKKQSFLKYIKEKTSAVVTLGQSRFDKVKICKVEGTEKNVENALKLIRKRMPAKHYPNFTMQRIFQASPETIVPLSNENLQYLQLNLIEGINNDVVVTSVMTGGHFFVQHPLHPSHPYLALLQKNMYDCYNSSEAPMLPSPEINAFCVLNVNGIWYRVQILDHDPTDKNRCLVKFMDFGGFLYTNFDELRQIRLDFMAYPFQATECVLSNIEPLEKEWYQHAADILCELTRGVILQAQVAGYNKDGIPEIYLFACLGTNNVIFINKELVARNLARWVEYK